MYGCKYNYHDNYWIYYSMFTLARTVFRVAPEKVAKHSSSCTLHLSVWSYNSNQCVKPRNTWTQSAKIVVFETSLYSLCVRLQMKTYRVCFQGCSVYQVLRRMIHMQPGFKMHGIYYLFIFFFFSKRTIHQFKIFGVTSIIHAQRLTSKALTSWKAVGRVSAHLLSPQEGQSRLPTDVRHLKNDPHPMAKTLE